MKLELRPRPVEVAPTLAEPHQPIGEPWPLRLTCWAASNGNPAQHTHPAWVSMLSDGVGQVLISDDDDGGVCWHLTGATVADLRRAARWLDRMPVWMVQAVDSRLTAAGWRRVEW